MNILEYSSCQYQQVIQRKSEITLDIQEYSSSQKLGISRNFKLYFLQVYNVIIGSPITALSPGDILVVTVIYNPDGQAVWAGRLITGGPPKPSANVFSNWCSVHVALSKWSFFRPDLYTTPRAQEIYIIL